VTAVADKRRAPPGDKRDGLTPDQGPGLAPKKVTVKTRWAVGLVVHHPAAWCFLGSARSVIVP